LLSNFFIEFVILIYIREDLSSDYFNLSFGVPRILKHLKNEICLHYFIGRFPIISGNIGQSLKTTVNALIRGIQIVNLLC